MRFDITRTEGTNTAQLVCPDGTQYTLDRDALAELVHDAMTASIDITHNPAPDGRIRQAAAEYRRDPGLDLTRRTV